MAKNEKLFKGGLIFYDCKTDQVKPVGTGKFKIDEKMDPKKDYGLRSQLKPKSVKPK